MTRRLRYGMIGGGPGAFIGEVHRQAAALDGETELVAGAFSTDPTRSHKISASSISRSVGMPKQVPRLACSVIAATISGCAWPWINVI